MRGQSYSDWDVLGLGGQKDQDCSLYCLVLILTGNDDFGQFEVALPQGSLCRKGEKNIDMFCKCAVYANNPNNYCENIPRSLQQ